jgi:hypothetical protein
MHTLPTFLDLAIKISSLILAIAISYISLQSIIKYEFEGNVSRGLYTFTAIFGGLALIGTIVSLTILICCLA